MQKKQHLEILKAKTLYNQCVNRVMKKEFELQDIDKYYQ
jgi:hypothetical protein